MHKKVRIAKETIDAVMRAELDTSSLQQMKELSTKKDETKLQFSVAAEKQKAGKAGLRIIGIMRDINNMNARPVGYILFNDAKKQSMNLLLVDKVSYKGQIINEYKALIPGCALGSFFANYTLKDCDQYFDDNNILYARYSDDIIIMGDSNEELQTHIEVVKKYLAEYGLIINESKYKWFAPSDEVEFLGLKITQTGDIDISDKGKQKIKRQIHRWCRKGRIEIEKGQTTFEKAAGKILYRLNHKNFICYIDHDNTFGWCHYAFRYITTIDTLKELDFYTKDTLRAMKTGKHNKANARVLNDEELKELGWVSLVELYNLYKFDFDYYCEVIELFRWRALWLKTT